MLLAKTIPNQVQPRKLTNQTPRQPLKTRRKPNPIQPTPGSIRGRAKTDIKKNKYIIKKKWNEVLNINGTDIVISNNVVTIISANNGLPNGIPSYVSGAGGKMGSPMKICQYTANKFETDEVHSSFWDQIEASNSVLRVVITNNEAIYPVGNDTVASQKRGFAQVWSKQSNPYTVEYSGNTISNLRFGLKIPLIDGFYSPNTTDEDHIIDLSATLTSVTYAASFLYKANPGGTGYPTASADKYGPQSNGVYSVENIAAFPSPPAVINPSTYAIITV